MSTAKNHRYAPYRSTGPLLGLIVLAILTTSSAWAQSNAGDDPEFDVASIRPSAPGNVGGSIRPGGATFAASNIPLIGLIAFAYDDIGPDRIDGAPGWVFSEPYDVVAKSEHQSGDPRADLGRQRQMLLKLLADRFQLRIRHEDRVRSMYALVVDKGGPKMKENNDLKSAPAPLIKFTARGRATAQIVSMAYLIRFLTSQVGQVVVDQTGLKGSYDFTLEWAPDPVLGARGGVPDASPPAQDSPSIFTALREQLGLGLESKKGPVDYIVVDHVERPSPN
jgi:uncharacterized protein (TIGR03435 family)